MKILALIQDAGRWAFLALTFATYVAAECAAIYCFYRVVGII